MRNLADILHPFAIVILFDLFYKTMTKYHQTIIYVSVVRWDQKNLKHEHERYNLDRRNLAAML
jgi:hypothetical protein